MTDPAILIERCLLEMAYTCPVCGDSDQTQPPYHDTVQPRPGFTVKDIIMPHVDAEGFLMHDNGKACVAVGAYNVVVHLKAGWRCENGIWK